MRERFRRRGVKVLRAIAEGPAYAAGIRDGDEIAAIDGRPVSEMSLEEARKLCRVPAAASGWTSSAAAGRSPSPSRCSD